MRINTINDNKIELYLSDEEVENIFGGYELIDYDAPECRIKIHSLIISAAPKTLFPLDCERVLIEVKPKEYGCTLTLTKVYSSIKKYRQVSRIKTEVYIFENSDNLLAALNALKNINAQYSELYTNENKYAVIVGINRKSIDTTTLLREYCKIICREIDALKIREYWQPICKTKAIKKLSEFF